MERFVDEPPRFKVAVANQPGAGLANRDQDVKRQVGHAANALRLPENRGCRRALRF
jgi:hypothetical protein